LNSCESEPLSFGEAVQHNDANMLSLGQRLLSEDVALEIVRTWLDTLFEAGRLSAPARADRNEDYIGRSTPCDKSAIAVANHNQTNPQPKTALQLNITGC